MFAEMQEKAGTDRKEMLLKMNANIKSNQEGLEAKIELCKSAMVLYLSIIKRTCNQGANKSIHPN
jgi:hypothetical protein